MVIISLMECFPVVRDQCNRTEGRQKPRTIALEMWGRLFVTQETGELD